LSIAAGPDGALWFTSSSNDAIGRISLAGQVTMYKHSDIDTPFAIVAGPDKALWFTMAANKAIGRITTAGHVTIFKLGKI
jgi:virginiamycin B lyase